MDEDVKIVDGESPTTGLSVTNAAAVGAADKQSSSESKEKDKVEGIEIVNVGSPTAGPEGISAAAVEASEKQSLSPESKEKDVIVDHEIDLTKANKLLKQRDVEAEEIIEDK